MSNQWNTSQLPSQSGQVKLFDPTKFQTPAVYGTASPNKPATQAPEHSVQSTQNVAYGQDSHSSWSSWGTWEWGSENNNQTAGKDKQLHDQQAQHLYLDYGGNTAVSSQYYTGGQGADSWSQSWNGADSHPQRSYGEGDTMAQYDQHQASQHDFQHYTGHSLGQGQDGVKDQSAQFQESQPFAPQYYDHLKEHQQTGDQGQEYNNFQNQHLQPQHDLQQYTGHMLGQGQDSASNQSAQFQESQQSHQFASHFFDHQQTGDQGQEYNQFQNQEAFLGNAHSFYDQPYSTSISAETGQSEYWSGHYQEQHLSNSDTAEIVASSQEQVNHPEDTITGSLQHPNNSLPSNHSSSLPPALEVHNDDDGTVSGFFGRDGDEDGNVQLDSKRLGYNIGDSGNEVPSGANQFLTVTSTLHRTNSEISNASLCTMNLSSSEDDDGRDQLHHVQELVQRMEELDMSRRVHEENSRNIGDTRDGMLEGHHPPIRADAWLNEDSDGEFGQVKHKGDYSGFGNSTYRYGDRKSSLHDGHKSECEGMSGPSGLPDWEIVPLHTGSETTHHNFINSNIFSDKPKSDLNTPDGLNKLQHTDKLTCSSAPFSTTSDQKASSNLRNMHPSNNGTVLNTSIHEPTFPDHDIRGRSGSPFVAAFTDHRQEESVPLASQITSRGDSTTQSKTGSNLSSSILLSADGTADAVKKEGVMNSRYDIINKPAEQIPPPSSNTWSKFPAAEVEDRETRNTSQRSDSQSSTPITAIPSKNKLSDSSLIEDDNCISGQDTDRSITSAGSSPTKGRQFTEPPLRSSSRNSEEAAASGQRRQHHSAFHPVSHPRQTTMSPATTLWDSSEVPASNIILAPAMPLIIPSLNSYLTSADTKPTTSGTGTASGDKLGASDIAVEKFKVPNALSSMLQVDCKDSGKKEEQNKGKEGKGKEDKNRSFDSLDEINSSLVEGQRHNRSYQNQRSDSRGLRYGQDTDKRDSYRRDPDRALSRNDRPSSHADQSGHYRYDRPLSRPEGHAKDDPYHRPRGYYRDYGDTSYDERYNRPRSRQDESRGSRPSSRSEQEVDRPRSRTSYDQRSGQEVDRPRSRSSYDRDRDYYYRDRNRADYSYDSYGRNVDYYADERERYYRYYREKEARYNRAYYEEYYGAKHADSYYQQHQLQMEEQQRTRKTSQDSDRSGSRQSRGSTPASVLSAAPTPPPGATSSRTDYYSNRSSRPSSSTDYSRDYYGRGYSYEGYSSYYDGYSYDAYAYGYGYPTYDMYNQAYDQGRLTPPKHSYIHIKACFGPAGQLVKVLPNRPTDGQPAIVEVQDVQSVLESCPEADELKLFPGPLTRTGTHKKDVLLYCQQKARACAEDINMVDRESAQLIWRFLELLIKQNGSVVGTDLSDLLLEGHEPTTHEYSVHGMKISQSPDVLDAVPEGSSETSSIRDSPAVNVTSDRTVINSAADREREKWIDRFRHLLLYGRRKDALECAMKNNLWGHALFLASKMDARTHANVMTRFANGAIRMNDPLQTLYQLMSGRQPAAVTCMADERWGDWRPHLAMILSNQTLKPEMERKSITVLGDTLASKGYLHASHFCYLMAQVNFGNYIRKTSKIVLIGSNHNLPLEEFATNEAIQCTEVYEYAQNLGNPAFCLPHFQIFKYLYACRLADYGMASEALQYCEVIAYNMQQYPTLFHSTLVKLVYQLSCRLKFSDPQRQISSEDVEDPIWLQQLEKLSFRYDDGSIQPLSGTMTPAGLGGTTTSSESGDYNTYGYVGDALVASSAPGAPHTDVYGQQQHVAQLDSHGYGGYPGITGGVQNSESASENAQQQNYTQPQYQGEYSQAQPQYQPEFNQSQPQNYTQPQYQTQQQYNYSQWHQENGYQQTGYGNQQQQSGTQQQQENAANTQDPNLSSTYADTSAQMGDSAHSHISGSSAFTDDISIPGGSSQLDSSSTSTHLSSQLHSSYMSGRRNTYPRGSTSTSEVCDDEDVDVDDDEDDDDGDGDKDIAAVPSGGFDYFGNYFGNVGTQRVVAPPHRYRNISGSSSSSTRRKRTISESSTGSVKASPYKPPPQQSGINRVADKVPKPGQQDGGGGGWFGGFFNKLKVKGKNEMILPDDKNPAIVWDPVRKKWTNSDGTEEENTPTAPPPKDTDLIGKPSGLGSSSAGPPPPSNIPGANRFSLKAKGARNQYVDINNPKPVSVPQNLYNIMPRPTTDSSAASSGLNLFMPSMGSSTEAKASDVNNSNVKNNLLPAANTTDKLSRSSSTSSLSREVQQYMAKPEADTSSTPAQTTVASSMPVLFNPTALNTAKSGKGQASSSSGRGLKSGQKRTYPK